MVLAEGLAPRNIIRMLPLFERDSCWREIGSDYWATTSGPDGAQSDAPQPGMVGSPGNPLLGRFAFTFGGKMRRTS